MRFVSTFVAFTCAPAMTAPLASVTVPTRVVEVIWADAAALTIDSEPGHGTTVRITMPAQSRLTPDLASASNAS